MTKKPRWPRYSGVLKCALPVDGKVADEIHHRLSVLCSALEIHRKDEGWELRLLAALLVRHVPGFCSRAKRSAKNLDAELIEFIDIIKDAHEAKDGRRPSTDAVVTEISSTRDPDNPWFGKNVGTLQRTYTGKDAVTKKTTRDIEASIMGLKNALGAQEAIKYIPSNSLARLIYEENLRRSQS